MKRHNLSKIKQVINSYREGSVITAKVITDYALEDAVKLKTLNAFIRLTPEIALHHAKESEFRYHEKKPKGDLDGIPVAIKDNFCTKNVPTTCASKMLEHFVPTYNATIYQRLLDNGAILIGKTNLDQYAMGAGTCDSIYGPTKNIWSEDLSEDNWRIAGGSSGGSATAVAAGICFAAIGSDTGGSTRNPASYCGVVGFKPTYGLVSRHGLIPLVNSMDVPGILSRNVDDCALVLNSIAGPCKFDSTTIKKAFNKISLPEVNNISLKSLRIGIPREYHCPGLSHEVLETWTKVADILQQAGARVELVSLPHTSASIFVYSILNQCEVSSNMARYDGIEYGYRSEEDSSTESLYATNRATGFNNVVKTRILAGNYLLLKQNYEKYFQKALKVRRLITNDFLRVFNAQYPNCVDILLTPTTLTDAPLYKDFIKESNRDQCAIQDFCTQPANMAGIPAISIPIRLSSKGLPISLQLMTKSLNETLLLKVAKWLEAQVQFDCLVNEQVYRARA